MMRAALDALARRSMEEPVFQRTLIVHPCWVPALLRSPGEAGLRPGDRLFSLARLDGEPVPVYWEDHVRTASQDGRPELQEEAPLQR